MCEEYSVKPASLPTTMPDIQSIKRKKQGKFSPLGGQSQWDSWKPIWVFSPHSPDSSIWGFWDTLISPVKILTSILLAIFIGEGSSSEIRIGGKPGGRAAWGLGVLRMQREGTGSGPGGAGKRGRRTPKVWPSSSLLVLELPPGSSQGPSSLQPNAPASGEPSLLPLPSAGSCHSRGLPLRSIPSGKSRKLSWADLGVGLWDRRVIWGPGPQGVARRGKAHAPLKASGLHPTPVPFSRREHGGVQKERGAPLLQVFLRPQSTPLISKYALKMCPQ